MARPSVLDSHVEGQAPVGARSSGEVRIPFEYVADDASSAGYAEALVVGSAQDGVQDRLARRMIVVVSLGVVGYDLGRVGAGGGRECCTRRIQFGRRMKRTVAWKRRRGSWIMIIVQTGTHDDIITRPSVLDRQPQRQFSTGTVGSPCRLPIISQEKCNESPLPFYTEIGVTCPPKNDVKG